jgi:hypothetical protein
MNAVEHVLLALIAVRSDDPSAAREHIARAQALARAHARRDRQVVEIATLVIAGCGERAAGLALEHTAEFPDDAALLGQIAGRTR